MATKKKLLQAAAGSAGGAAGADVEDIFAIHTYIGNGSNRSFTNNVDLSTDGGLVWIKPRNQNGAYYDPFHVLVDSERGVNNVLNTDSAKAENWTSFNNTVTAFNTDGFTIGSSNYVNYSGDKILSYSFKKTPKFFDVVTYSGNNTSGREIAHNLGTTPGFIIVKCRDALESWICLHRYDGTTWKDGYLDFANAWQTARVNKFGTGSVFVAPTDTHFTVDNGDETNGSGKTYVAYLFAHNDGDAEFGPTGDMDVVKCGHYIGNGSNAGPTVDLGFEPQLLMLKNIDGNREFYIMDVERGFSSQYARGISPSSYPKDLPVAADTATEEYNYNLAGPTATGFQIETSDAEVNASGQKFIYVAIRRGTKIPEAVSDVFAQDNIFGDSGGTSLNVGFNQPDLWLSESNGGASAKYLMCRLTNMDIRIDGAVETEANNIQYLNLNYATNIIRSDGWWGSATQEVNVWKRAPQFLDVVAYQGDGTSSNAVAHNLTVAPEMIIAKHRNDSAKDQVVYHTGMGSTKFVQFHQNHNEQTGTTWANTDPTDTHFYVGSSSFTNTNGSRYLAYLFATLPGISKVGTYTGNADTTQDIDCGFSNGVKFLLIKRITGTINYSGKFYYFTQNGGINSGNDLIRALSDNTTYITDEDAVDQTTTGFRVDGSSGTANLNQSGDKYIFYAVAK